MALHTVLQQDSQQKVLVESSRVSLYLLLLVVSIVSYLFSEQFINWTVLAPFYSLMALALLVHLGIVYFLDSFFSKPKFLFATFILDSLLISGLIYFSSSFQSLFLFLHLINILLAGLVFRTSGAMVIALLTSSELTLIALLGPELKPLPFFLTLGLNNVATFLVAGLAGYLSELLFSTEMTLKEIETLNRFVVANMPSGMLSFDSQGRVLQKNEAAEKILQFSGPSLFIDYPELQKWIHSEDDLQRQEKEHKRGETTEILGWVLQKAKNPLTEEPLWIALVDDLTKVKKLVYSLRQSEKLAAVGGLAAGIAHEIRNPLAGMSGSIEMLSQTTQNEDDQKLMKIILKEIDRLNRLITEFLDYARPETPPTETLELGPLLREVIDSLKLNPNLRHDVRVDLDLPSGLQVLGKRDKLKQAFLNMALNAFQALAETKEPYLSVRAQKNKNEMIITFKDNGMGMRPETLKKMFEPFHTTKPKGTGLGLAVTHKILENHSVQISVQSELGQGTEFTLVFPCLK